MQNTNPDPRRVANKTHCGQVTELSFVVVQIHPTDVHPPLGSESCLGKMKIAVRDVFCFVFYTPTLPRW